MATGPFHPNQNEIGGPSGIRLQGRPGRLRCILFRRDQPGSLPGRNGCMTEPPGLAGENAMRLHRLFVTLPACCTTAGLFLSFLSNTSAADPASERASRKDSYYYYGP